MSDAPEVKAMAARMIAQMRKEAKDAAEAAFLVTGVHPGEDDYQYLDVGITAGITACMEWFRAKGLLTGVDRA